MLKMKLNEMKYQNVLFRVTTFYEGQTLSQVNPINQADLRLSH